MAKYLTEEQHTLVMDILYAELHARNEAQGEGENTTAELVEAIDGLDELMIALGYGETND